MSDDDTDVSSNSGSDRSNMGMYGPCWNPEKKLGLEPKSFSFLRFAIWARKDLGMVRQVYDTDPVSLEQDMLNFACVCGAAPGVVAFLVKLLPEGAKKSDEDGCYPLHHALRMGPAPGTPTCEDIKALVDANPDCLTRKGRLTSSRSATPLSLCLDWKYERSLIEFIFSKVPKHVEEWKVPDDLCCEHHHLGSYHCKQYGRHHVDSDCVRGIQKLLSNGHVTTLTGPFQIDNWKRESFNELIDMILQSKFLECVTFFFFPITRGPLDSFFSIENLQDCSIETLAISGKGKYFTMLIDSLALMPNLELLVLMADRLDRHVSSLCKLLRKDNLEHLAIAPHRPCKHISPLFESIQSSSLKRFVYMKQSESDKALVCQYQKKMLNIVKQNVSLVYVEFKENETTIPPETAEAKGIEYYITLNRCGRGIARDPNASLVDFIDCVASVGANEENEEEEEDATATNIRYELLSQLPALWHPKLEMK